MASDTTQVYEIRSLAPDAGAPPARYDRGLGVPTTLTAPVKGISLQEIRAVTTSKDTKTLLQGLLLGTAIAAVALGAFVVGQQAAERRQTTAIATSSTTTAVATPDSQVAATAVPSAAATASSLTMTLVGGTLDVVAAVPDEATADRIRAAATRVSRSANASIEVDPTLLAAGWLETADTAMVLLPMMVEASVTATGETVAIAGTAPTQSALDQFTIGIARAFPTPDLSSSLQLTIAPHPVVAVAYTNGDLSITGVLHNDVIAGQIRNAAVSLYGPDAVTDNLRIDESVYNSAWAYTLPGLLEQLSAFPRFEVRLADGAASGSFDVTSDFAPGSSELTETTRGVAELAIVMLKRDLTAALTVESHTDNSGSDADNQTLSELRAASVAEVIAAAGINPERIDAIGYGADQPVASNDTDEGRATNRRVVIRFGPRAQSQ